MEPNGPRLRRIHREEKRREEEMRVEEMRDTTTNKL